MLPPLIYIEPRGGGKPPPYHGNFIPLIPPHKPQFIILHLSLPISCLGGENENAVKLLIYTYFFKKEIKTVKNRPIFPKFYKTYKKSSKKQTDFSVFLRICNRTLIDS